MKLVTLFLLTFVFLIFLLQLRMAAIESLKAEPAEDVRTVRVPPMLKDTKSFGGLGSKACERAKKDNPKMDAVLADYARPHLDISFGHRIDILLSENERIQNRKIVSLYEEQLDQGRRASHYFLLQHFVSENGSEVLKCGVSKNGELDPKSTKTFETLLRSDRFESAIIASFLYSLRFPVLQRQGSSERMLLSLKKTFSDFCDGLCSAIRAPFEAVAELAIHKAFLTDARKDMAYHEYKTIRKAAGLEMIWERKESQPYMFKWLFSEALSGLVSSMPTVAGKASPELHQRVIPCP